MSAVVAAGVQERFVAMACREATLLGVLSSPPSGAHDIGVVIVVGGPQYRAGSHRQFVQLSRALAAAGHPVLRFDYRGMGDSEGARRTFEDVHDDLAAAVDALVQAAGVSRVVLWGLCDGASAALMSASRLPRVAGVAAVNPWARSAATQAAARLKHYYAGRLLDRAYWRKLVRGETNVVRTFVELARTLRTRVAHRPTATPRDYLSRIEHGLGEFARPVLVVLSGRDYTAREFEAWIDADAARRALLERAADVVRCPDADHTFSGAADRDALAAHTLRWLARVTPAAAPAAR